MSYVEQNKSAIKNLMKVLVMDVHAIGRLRRQRRMRGRILLKGSDFVVGKGGGLNDAHAEATLNSMSGELSVLSVLETFRRKQDVLVSHIFLAKQDFILSEASPLGESALD